MQEILGLLKPADYGFLVGLIESNVNLTDDSRLREAVAALEKEDDPEQRALLNGYLEKEIRYLGSAEIAYFARYAMGREPGIPFSEIIRDVAKTLKIDLTTLGTDREMLDVLVRDYATRQFAALTPEEQQRLLEELGVDRERAAGFIKKSAGIFTLPLLIQAFDAVIVQGLIKNVIFGTIARIIGKQLSGKLFAFLAGRMPWWLSWIGPAAWSLSIGWAVLDIQGPAYRKTIPVVLYLGLVSLREGAAASASA